MSKTNIAVLVSGGGTNLQALIDAEKSGIIKSGKISLVISSKPGVYALERAEKAGIKTAVCERKAFADKKDFDNALLALPKEEVAPIEGEGFVNVDPTVAPTEEAAPEVTEEAPAEEVLAEETPKEEITE